MNFAIEVVPFGDFSDPRLLTRIAQAAEASGWDGLFLWDHLAYVFGWPGMDPWVGLSAAAAVTEKIKLGVNVSPLPRYRPHVLAQTLASLDLLSRGRLIFGAGLGAMVEEFDRFGDPAEPRIRAAMLDEALEMLDGLLRGQKVDHHGAHYTAREVTLTPLPIQKPRPPIWIGGESRPALRRAARWDGWVIPGIDMDAQITVSPEDLAARLEYIHSQRLDAGPFEAAISGCTQPGETELPARYAQAGATWWLESLYGFRGSSDEMISRVEAGPPR